MKKENLFDDEPFYEEDAITVDLKIPKKKKERTDVTKKYFYSSLDYKVYNYLSDSDDFDDNCKLIIG